MLALVAYSLKPVKRLGLYKRTQQCCGLLRPYAWAFRFDNEYDHAGLKVRLFGTTKFLTRVRGIVVGSNLVAVLLFTTMIAEDLVVNITSSKDKKSYS